METPRLAWPQTRRPSPRRSFFLWFTAGLAPWRRCSPALPSSGYFLRTRQRHGSNGSTWGRSSEFPVDETRLRDVRQSAASAWDGMVAHRRLRAERGQGRERQRTFLVLGVNCAHLGCPVTWFPQSGLFMCPCHGGVYYADGSRASARRRAAFFAACGGSGRRSWRFRLRITRRCKTRLTDTGLIGRQPVQGRTRNAADVAPTWPNGSIAGWRLASALLPMLRHPIPERSPDRWAGGTSSAARR